MSVIIHMLYMVVILVFLCLKLFYHTPKPIACNYQNSKAFEYQACITFPITFKKAFLKQTTCKMLRVLSRLNYGPSIIASNTSSATTLLLLQ